MKFYHFAIHIIKYCIVLLNGKPKVYGLEHLPKDQPFILASTHRSNTDPFFMAFVTYPHAISFMAKDSLFKNPILGSLLKAGKVFPVNREKPSAKTIKHSVKVLTEDKLNLGIFPTGSRHRTEVKGGTAFIQKLSQSPIVPATIQPPMGFWQFVLRKKAKIAFGQPLYFDKSAIYTKEKLNEIDQWLANQFTILDKMIDPNYYYEPKRKKTS